MGKVARIKSHFLFVILIVPAFSSPELQPVIVSSGAGASSAVPRCEEITVPLCRGVGYNMTAMPNEFNHDTQEEAGFEAHQFWPLVEINCSTELKFFLCSLYTPICIKEYPVPLKVCRSVCERVRAGCSPLMTQYGFLWPDRMNCENLPVKGNPEVVCMEPPEDSRQMFSGQKFGKIKPPPPVLIRPPAKCKPGQKFCGPGSSQPTPIADCTCKCNGPLVNVDRTSVWYNQNISVGSVDNCALPCNGAFFTKEDQDSTTRWIQIWAGLCCAATLMTLTTFLIDTERFKYPERPIIFLSGCYFLVSIGYLIRVFLGHKEVACDGSMIIYSAHGPKPCTLVFLLIYFFSMASSLWWVILTFTWFLAAGFKWSNEAIASYSQYFHLVAWLIPTVKSVGVLIMSGVDGDPIGGICHVGNQDPSNLRKFVLIPLVVYLMIGISFLFIGFVSLFRIRSVFKSQGGLGGRSKADKLEKLMMRIGIFSFMYTLPATCLIACYVYESTYYNDWMNLLVCPCANSDQKLLKQKPIYYVFMAKYFMALIVGITSGVWIWSSKTFGSWKRLWNRLFGREKNHKPVLDDTVKRGYLQQQQQYLIQPQAIPATGSSLLSGPHITPTSNMPFLGHHMQGGGMHHHMIKQAQQAPLSHV